MENSGNSSGRWLREEEYSRLWMLLEMFMESTAPLSMLVITFGKAGTGKTTLARRIVWNATSAWKDLRIIYLDSHIDCRNGFSAVLQRVLNLSGYSTFEILRNMEESNHKFLIIIDNAENIIDEKSVKNILKINEGFPNGRFFILLFFGSTDIPIRTLSFSQPLYFMHLSPYGPNEIRMILSFYLSNSNTGSPFVSEDALNTIIKASRGNANLALEILKLAMCLHRPIGESHVLEALKMMSKYPLYYRSIKISDPHAEAILKVVSRHPQGVRLKKLFEEYHSFCRDNEIRPLGYTQFWKKIRILEKKMLLDFKVINLKEGRTGIVRVKCTSGETNL
ncbi:MAG: hypothetical protein QXJ45_01555 [Thermoproteota archaeon]